jgi:hypothetical protein
MKNFGHVVTVNDPSGGAMETIAAPANENETVNVYLMPGAIVQVQNNTAHEFKTTSAIQANGTTSLVINPDDQLHANGNVFLDDGESLDVLENRQYEFYRFVMNKGTLQKRILNEDNRASTGVMIDNIVVTNAGAWKSIDFACVKDINGQNLTVTVDHDTANSVITFSGLNDTGISFFDFNALYFGNSQTDVNFCSPSNQYY